MIIELWTREILINRRVDLLLEGLYGWRSQCEWTCIKVWMSTHSETPLQIMTFFNRKFRK